MTGSMLSTSRNERPSRSGRFMCTFNCPSSLPSNTRPVVSKGRGVSVKMISFRDIRPSPLRLAQVNQLLGP